MFPSVLSEFGSNDETKRSTIVESEIFCSVGIRAIQWAIPSLCHRPLAIAFITWKVLWLSWLKRLPSKQEITSSILVGRPRSSWFLLCILGCPTLRGHVSDLSDISGVVFGEKLGFAKYYSAKLIFRPVTIEKMAKTGHFSTFLVNGLKPRSHIHIAYNLTFDKYICQIWEKLDII